LAEQVVSFVQHRSTQNNIKCCFLLSFQIEIPLMELDAIDWKILDLMQADARLSNVELARQIGLSPSPCLTRVRALEKGGYISRYVTLLDSVRVGLRVSVFIQVTLERQIEAALETFERAIRARPEVMECYLMTGDADYLLRVVVPDVEAYERFLREVLTRIESVAGIKSSFALKQVKYLTTLPVAAFARDGGSRTEQDRTPRTRQLARRTEKG